jgi:hypothetical protein
VAYARRYSMSAYNGLRCVGALPGAKIFLPVLTPLTRATSPDVMPTAEGHRDKGINMSTDHTPGAWFAWDRAVMSEATGMVCHMEKTNPNRDSDQRLILAAPEMLAALRLVQGLAIDSDVSATVYAAVKAAMEPARPPRQARRPP